MEPPYRWIPGFGPDLAALDVLIQFGPRPPHPFREYTLTGQERGVYTELLEHNISAVRTADLMRYFNRVTDLVKFHGPQPEKDRWFHYLFAELTRRIPGIGNGWTEPDPKVAATLPNRFLLFGCDCSLIELLVDAYIRIRPLPFPPERRARSGGETEQHERKPRLAVHTDAYRQAVLATVGQALMRPLWWEAELHKLEQQPFDGGRSDPAEPSGEFSSVMYLCVRYLAPDQIDPWLQSVLAIRHPVWLLNLVLWLEGSYWTLESEPPFQKGHYDPNRMPPFLTGENRTALKAGLQRHLTQELALGWADQIMALDIFDWEIELRLEQFLRKCFTSGASIRW